MLFPVVLSIRLRVEIGSRLLRSDVCGTASYVIVLIEIPSYGNYQSMNAAVKYVKPNNYRSQVFVESFVFQLAIQKFKG
jgi:hypothetical protein